MSKADQDNLNPTPPAVAAMYLYGDDYAAQSGGSMDFWRSLPPWKQGTCRDLVRDIETAIKRRSR